MRDSVIAVNRQTCERSAIEDSCATLDCEPPRSTVTGRLMLSAALLPNLTIRDLGQHCR